MELSEEVAFILCYRIYGIIEGDRGISISHLHACIRPCYRSLKKRTAKLHSAVLSNFSMPKLLQSPPLIVSALAFVLYQSENLPIFEPQAPDPSAINLPLSLQTGDPGTQLHDFSISGFQC